MLPPFLVRICRLCNIILCTIVPPATSLPLLCPNEHREEKRYKYRPILILKYPHCLIAHSWLIPDFTIYILCLNTTMLCRGLEFDSVVAIQIKKKRETKKVRSFFLPLFLFLPSLLPSLLTSREICIRWWSTRRSIETSALSRQKNVKSVPKLPPHRLLLLSKVQYK